jgi:hypothetical protein
LVRFLGRKLDHKRLATLPLVLVIYLALANRFNKL